MTLKLPEHERNMKARRRENDSTLCLSLVLKIPACQSLEHISMQTAL